jgi:hypothetical protein
LFLSLRAADPTYIRPNYPLVLSGYHCPIKMSTALRLYRELTVIDPNRKALDPYFKEEKKRVQADVHGRHKSRGSSITISSSSRGPSIGIEPHHGKIARAKTSAMIKSVQVTKINDKHVQDVIKQADRINKLVKQIAPLVQRGEAIPEKFLKSLESNQSNPSSNGTSSGKGGSSSSSAKTSVPCSVIFRPAYKESPGISASPLKTKMPTSMNQWTPGEMKEMNLIFDSLAKPKNRDKIHWDMYYHSFIVRFHNSYPRKPTSEVMTKINELLGTNRFHKRSECEYWTRPVT